MKKKKYVTVPRIHNPGKGRPAETLAYLSPIEHEMIRKLTDGTYERGPNGIRSYADDSASSNGVSRGDKYGTKGNGGLGQGGQNSGSPSGGGSKASGSPNSGTSTGGSAASKSSSSSSSNTGQGGQGGQRGAGSNYGPGSGRPGTTSTATGRAAEAAQANAARASGTATQWGGRSYSSPLTAGNGSYYGPKGGTALNTDARMAAARSVGFNAPAVSRTPGDAEMMGRMMMAESGIIKNQYGNPNTFGLQGVGDVIRNRMLSENYPNTLRDVLSQRSQFTPWGNGEFKKTPANATATRIAESILSGESPSVVGNSLNYGNLDTINNKPGYSSATTKKGFNGMDVVATVADYRNPNTYSHSFGTWGKPSDVAFNAPGTYNPGFGGTQVAGIANAGVGEASRLQKAQDALRTLSAPSPTIPSDPRVGLPQGGFPASPPRPAAGTYTSPYNRPVQGPQRYAGPAQAIPAPQSIGMMAPASAFANDPRAGLPQGAYPSASPAPKMQDRLDIQTPYGAINPSTVDRMSPEDQQRLNAYAQTPTFSAPPQIATDPRGTLTPFGSYPAAAPQKEVQLAWNVPPLGGALPSWKADALGVWGTNRKPSGPAAQPGTIHSQTAQADEKPSFWQQAGDLYNTASTAVQNKVQEAKATPEWKFAQEHPRLAEFALKMMMGGGGRPNGLLGTPQDRSGPGRPFIPPPMQQTAQAQAPAAPEQDQLSMLLQMQQDMIANGADPEELAAVQALIDQLSTQEA